MLPKRLDKISPRPLGGVELTAAVSSLMLNGKRKLAKTAVALAKKEASKYSMVTILKRPPTPCLVLANAFRTRIKTKTGATPFNPPTNKVPKMATPEIAGAKYPKAAPMTIPITIRTMRLVFT